MRPDARKRPRRARRGLLAAQFAPMNEDHAPAALLVSGARRDRPTSFQRSFRRLAVDRAPAVPDRMHVDHLLKRRCAIRITDADVFSQTVLAPHLITVAGICDRFFSSLMGKSPLHNLAHFTQTYFSRPFRQ